MPAAWKSAGAEVTKAKTSFEAVASSIAAQAGTLVLMGMRRGGSLARSWLPVTAAPGLVLSPRSGATLVLRRCYTGCSLLCQGEVLSKF
jgi:hypothetical protein